MPSAGPMRSRGESWVRAHLPAPCPSLSRHQLPSPEQPLGATRQFPGTQSSWIYTVATKVGFCLCSESPLGQGVSGTWCFPGTSPMSKVRTFRGHCGSKPEGMAGLCQAGGDLTSADQVTSDWRVPFLGEPKLQLSHGLMMWFDD